MQAEDVGSQSHWKPCVYKARASSRGLLRGWYENQQMQSGQRLLETFALPAGSP